MHRNGSHDLGDLLGQAREGSVRAVARLISLVEDDAPQLPELMASLAPHAGRAWVVGITGSPGVGKSTTTSALVTVLRARRLRVGVLAVDPSSPFSGGALLGDRVRMGEHALDPDVYIRSMATRGHLGGLARATPQALRVLDAAGCDVVLVETVGVGQSEVAVAGSADTTLVLLAPGMGDGVQAAKAGLLEVADVLGVNKADRDGAKATVNDLRGMVSLAERRDAGDWRAPVVSLVASRGEGVEELLEALEKHRDWAAASGEAQRRRRRRVAAEVEEIVLAELRTRMGGTGGVALEAAADEVVAGQSDPYAAARQVLNRLGDGAQRGDDE